MRPCRQEMPGLQQVYLKARDRVSFQFQLTPAEDQGAGDGGDAPPQVGGCAKVAAPGVAL